jgi:hypothetical protein
MGLRLSEGIPSELAEGLERKRVDALIGEGYLARDATHLRPTAAGLQRLNAVISYLVS